MSGKVYIFDTHPVQYKAPVYQALERMRPGLFEVIYASDLSVKGQLDKEFGVEVAWDTPLMQGYDYRVLNTEDPKYKRMASRFGSRGVYELIRNERPAAVMLTQATYHFDRVAYLSALMHGVPILIRQETQDLTYAHQRGFVKSVIRDLIYRAYYWPASHAFAFGDLNKVHLMAHGLPEQRLSYARFSVANPVGGWSESEKRQVRESLRAQLGIEPSKRVIGFFGKFIPKKNPDLVMQALKHMPPDLLANLCVMYVGAGELEPVLREMAAEAEQEYGVQTVFAGFVNQSRLHEYYLATDVMTLPSRHLGETWGLVVNEALNAGCAVAITDGVGCYVEFGDLPRVRVSPTENAKALAQSFGELLVLERNFGWASERMKGYSTEAAAEALGNEFIKYVK